MFTGIVAGIGVVEEVRLLEGAHRVRIHAPGGLLGGVVPGASIAVDGACLTAVEVAGDRFAVDVVASTLERTVAGRYAARSRVNLEKAMVLGERLDGHLVQGHVDGVGKFLGQEREGETRFLTFTVPVGVWRQTILHGSIALNGISLTVDHLFPPDRVRIAVIPHTWSRTNLSDLAPGDGVNVEGDLLGKYVGRMLASHLGSKPEGGATAPDRRRGPT